MEMNQAKHLNIISTPILYPVAKILRANKNQSLVVYTWVHSFLEIFRY